MTDLPHAQITVQLALLNSFPIATSTSDTDGTDVEISSVRIISGDGETPAPADLDPADYAAIEDALRHAHVAAVRTFNEHLATSTA